MKIERFIHQHRNDFTAILECEHCSHRQKLLTGYNDHFYHNSVLPAIKCQSCGQSRIPADVSAATEKNDG